MPLLALLGGGIPWKWVGIGAGILVILFGLAYCQSQVKKIGRLEAENHQLAGVAAQNAEAAKAAVAESARLQDIVDQAATKKAGIRKKFDSQRETIIHAPASDDGPIAPVLRRTLDSLRPRDGGGESNPAPKPGAGGAPAPVRRPGAPAG